MTPRKPLTPNDERHGSSSGYNAHYSQGIPVCDACRTFNQQRHAQRRVDSYVETGAPRGRVTEALGELSGDQSWKFRHDLPCGVNPDWWFVRGAAQKKPAELCRDFCPVVTECGEWALNNRIEWGVYGGMTERERRAITKRSAA